MATSTGTASLPHTPRRRQAPRPELQDTPHAQAAYLLCDIWVAGHPISVNAAYGHRRAQTGAPVGAYLTRAARDWRTAVASAALLYRQAISADVRFHLTSSSPRFRTQTLQVMCEVVGVRGDVDNYLKLALDGLKQGLQIDDRYISYASATRGSPTRAQPQGMRLTVLIADLAQTDLVTARSTDGPASPVASPVATPVSTPVATMTASPTVATTDRTALCNTAVTTPLTTPLTTQPTTRVAPSSHPTTGPDAASVPVRRRSRKD